MIIKTNDLYRLKNRNIIICAGWFDLFHVGHLRFLNNAKKEADILLVVVMNDKDGRFLKGETRPIINQNDRAEIINNLKCVNYVFISTCIKNNNPYPNNLGDDIKTKVLWDRYIPIIEFIKPKKVFSLEETLKYNYLGKYIENLGIEVIYSERTENVSTTDIESKLKIAK